MSAVLSRLFITPRVSILFQWLVNKTSTFFRFSSFFSLFFFSTIFNRIGKYRTEKEFSLSLSGSSILSTSTEKSSSFQGDIDFKKYTKSRDIDGVVSRRYF